MEMKLFQQGRFLALLVSIAFVIGCTPLIGAYSPTAYQNATSLKAETLAIMAMAKEPYAGHKDQVEQLNIELNKAYEYVKGQPRNSISPKQWKLLIDKNGDLIGKFFKRWQERSTLSDAYIGEFKSLVSDAFDEIICLEANKQKAIDCTHSQGEE